MTTAFYLMDHSDPLEINGPRIKRYRIQKGITTAQLAEKASVSRDLLLNLEADKTSLCLPTYALRIAQALDLSINQLRG